MFCKNCGKEIADNAVMCPNCGSPIQKASEGEKSKMVALLLCLFLGFVGGQSFYTGKIGVGICQLLTLGGCGIWTLIDLITIITGSYKDSEGKTLK